ncbi:MAG: efflux RND transporter periplasmic adaptor subunit, partial [Chloroflexi bacterium]|nr:efflux RND transporter periplasmic adaptor subunit [Chloroflexota bacterium]
LAGGFWLWKKNQSPTPASTPQWQTQTLTRGDLRATVGATGEVEADRSARLIWQTAGRVARAPQVGDTVSAGQVLMELARDSWPQSLLQAEAQLLDLQQQYQRLQQVGLAQAWNQYAEARYQEDRAEQTLQSLYDQIAEGEVISDITLERYESAKALATAQREYAEQVYREWKEGSPPDLAKIEAQMAALQSALDLARLTAPFDGTVTAVYTPVDTPVQPGTLALRVDDLDTLWVVADITEFDIPTVDVGQEVEVVFDGLPYQTFHGVVEEVAAVGTPDPASGAMNFPVRIRLTDADERIRPGMTAAVTIFTQTYSDVLLVPNRAVRVVDGQPTVYVLRNGQPEPVTVRLGASSGEYSVLLEGDLAEGDAIVLNPPGQDTLFGP